MQGPRIAIIGKERHLYHIVKDAFASYNGPLPEITHAPNIAKHLNSGVWATDGPNVWIVDYTPAKMVDALVGLRAISPTQNPSFFMVSPSGVPVNRDLVNILPYSHWYTYSPDSSGRPLAQQLVKGLDRLIEDGRIFTRVKTAIFGLGNFGSKLLSLIGRQEVPWISNVSVYSKHLNTERLRDKLIKTLDLDPRKVTFFDEINHWVDKACEADLVSYNAGPRICKYDSSFREDNAIARQHAEKLRRNTVPIISALGSQLRNRPFSGIWCCASNPVGLCSAEFAAKSLIDPTRIVGFTTDHERAVRIIYRHIEAENKSLASMIGSARHGNSPENCIDVAVFGSHQAPIPVLDLCNLHLNEIADNALKRLPDRGLRQIIKIDDELEQQIERELRAYGPEVMEYSKSSDTGYSGAPQALRAAWQRIAHYRHLPHSSQAIWDEQEGFFSLRPTIYDRKQGTFHERYSVEDIPSPILRERVKSLVNEEKLLMGKYKPLSHYRPGKR